MKFVPVTSQELYFSPTVELQYAQTECGLLFRSRDCGTHVCVEEYTVAAFEKREHFRSFLCTYKADCVQATGDVVPAGEMFLIHFLPDVNGECKTGCIIYSVDGSFSSTPHPKH